MRTVSLAGPRREKFIVGNYRERRYLEDRLHKYKELSSEWGDYFYFFDEFLAKLKSFDVKTESEFDDCVIEFMSDIEDSYVESGELMYSRVLGEFLLAIENVISRLYDYLDSVEGFSNIQRIQLQPAPRSAVVIIQRDNR